MLAVVSVVRIPVSLAGGRRGTKDTGLVMAFLLLLSRKTPRTPSLQDSSELTLFRDKVDTG